jgi:DNA-binding NarL/FixJ family response regulator
MIVDDHAGARDMIRKLLDLPGIKILECASGDEAVWMVHTFKPDWVTMDVRMPGMNGIDATDLLRKKFPSARVVVVSNDDSPYIRRAALKAGAAAFFGKEQCDELRDFFSSAATQINGSANKEGGSK